MVQLKGLSTIGEIFGMQEEINSFASLIQLIFNSVRREDIIGRAKKWGRFYIILPETSLQGALAVARRILIKIEELFYKKFKRHITAYIVTITYNAKNITSRTEPQTDIFFTLAEKSLEIIERKNQTKIISLYLDKDL